ncbi:MAG: DUF4494 family protein [Clostridia bacterium]|nr:DUF4494 family protein [Clostridia bacterium]
MQTGFDFYRIKTEWTSEREGGALAKTKTEELVYASSYSEAEKVAYALAENQNRTQFGSISIEILKTKITELVYNNVLTQDTELTAGLVCNFFEEAVDTEVGLYCVKVMYMVVDEKTGKEKRSNENIYVPATSNIEAAQFVHAYLKKVGETREFIIRDTKFDRAEAILWPTDVHQEKVRLIGA